MQAKVEETLMELIIQEYSIKVILMSLFYFWFTLEAPAHAADPESVAGEDVFLHMGVVIEIIKNTVRSLPNQRRTPEIEALNEKMQILKSYLPHPEILDKLVPENIENKLYTLIHRLTP